MTTMSRTRSNGLLQTLGPLEWSSFLSWCVPTTREFCPNKLGTCCSSIFVFNCAHDFWNSALVSRPFWAGLGVPSRWASWDNQIQTHHSTGHKSAQTNVRSLRPHGKHNTRGRCFSMVRCIPTGWESRMDVSTFYFVFCRPLLCFLSEFHSAT